jgi:hypothetical protein
LIAASFWSGDIALLGGLFSIVPPLLGIFAAALAAHKVSLRHCGKRERSRRSRSRSGSRSAPATVPREARR